MIEKIINLVKQMSMNERKHLYSQIKRDYSLEEKDNMMRDDILEKVHETLYAKDEDLMTGELSEDSEIGRRISKRELSETLEEEFEIEINDFSEVMGWVTVGDVVDTIENILEESNYE